MATACKDCVGRLLAACRGELCWTERACLIEEAEREAVSREHILTEFVKEGRYSVWRAECSRCGRAAVIQIDPKPGEPMVYGEATTRPCSTPLSRE